MYQAQLAKSQTSTVVHLLGVLLGKPPVPAQSCSHVFWWKSSKSHQQNIKIKVALAVIELSEVWSFLPFSKNIGDSSKFENPLENLPIWNNPNPNPKLQAPSHHRTPCLPTRRRCSSACVHSLPLPFVGTLRVEVRRLWQRWDEMGWGWSKVTPWRFLGWKWPFLP